jgi:hypothetical protein
VNACQYTKRKGVVGSKTMSLLPLE